MAMNSAVSPISSVLTTYFLAILVIITVVDSIRRSSRNTMIVKLVTDSHQNESLVLQASLNGVDVLFMLDTAYAGPPVLSTSYLSLLLHMKQQGTYRRLRSSPLTSQYEEVTRSLKTGSNGHGGYQGVTKEEAVRSFMAESRSRAYTSGCTMRLMGIGETAEAQADMILCDNVLMGGASPHFSEVFVTHRLPLSINILTMDFLFHRSPSVIRPRLGTVTFYAKIPLREFSFTNSHLLGGSVCVNMDVGGAVLRIILDTGATACLSLSPSAVPRVSQCELPKVNQTIHQIGVNGERVCSQAFQANIKLAGIEIQNVQVLSNSTEVEGADGYAGIGLLRSFNMCFTHTTVGFSASGLPPKGFSSLSQGSCQKAILPSSCKARGI
jgi:predicted aspartyl protease